MSPKPANPTIQPGLHPRPRPAPIERALGAAPYAPPASGAPIDLFLDANEGPGGCVDFAELASELGPDAPRRYPSASALERAIASRFGLDPSRVLVTAGGDEAIDRACRAFLEPGRQLILPTPTFEMIARYAGLAGAEVVTTPWTQGPFPLEAVLALVNQRTAMIAMVSPNNPTGAVATADDLHRLAAATPEALLLTDLAYAEFADEDLTSAALDLPNVLVIRTFSKAFGLAGMRIGYAIGPEPLIRCLRAVGSPYPVSALSLRAAERALDRADDFLPGVIAQVRSEREQLQTLLQSLGAHTLPSQANFVLAEFADAEWVWRALAALGIAVRRFAQGSGLERSLRITCPGWSDDLDRLCAALRAALRPQALLFDMDGVLADVSHSYRRAIALTAGSFGVSVSPADISAAKAEPNSNNDWALTHRLVTRRGASASLADVTTRFEALYNGAGGAPGLEATERLIAELAALRRLADRLPLAIVTGRPRRDCDRFLNRFGLADLFRAIVCMEDAQSKPDPAPVRLALNRLGVSDAWLIGDTSDDIASGRAAGVVPIGIAPPGDEPERVGAALRTAGAATVLDSLSDLEGLLP